MATNSNNNGGNSQTAGSGRKPSGSAAQRPKDRDLPAVDREPELANGQKQNVCQTACSQEEKKGYHLWRRDRSDPVHGSSIVSGNDSYQQ